MKSVFTIGLALFATLGVGSAAASSAWVVADIDGDRKPDFISVNGRRDVRLGAVDTDTLKAASRSPLQRLRARDLDGDSDRDLILESLTSKPIAIWINDGAGHFKRGNLEDFRFQLSHETQQSLGAAHKLLIAEFSDDTPRSDVAAARTVVQSDLSIARKTAQFDQAAITARNADTRSRAPPSFLQ